MSNLQINDKQHTRYVHTSRHLRRFYKTTVCKLYRKHGRILYNMAFNLRRIRCLATQTTAIGFHLMNQARAFGSIFVLWARLKLNVLPFPFHPFAYLRSFYIYFLRLTPRWLDLIQEAVVSSTVSYQRVCKIKL